MGKQTKTVRALCLDGGGVRGILPAMFLADIERRTKKPVSEIFDIISGTSIGGPLAFMAAAGDSNGKPVFTGEQIVENFRAFANEVFKPNILRSIWAIGGLRRPRYGSSGFKRVLKNVLGDLKLSDSLTDTLVPSYDIEKHEAVWFKSSKARTDPDRDFYLRDACLGATAIPSILDIAKISNINGSREFVLIDGGLAAPQTGAFALTEIRKTFTGNHRTMIVSFGTGQPPLPISYNAGRKWGGVRWFMPLMKLFVYAPTLSLDHLLTVELPPINGKPYYYRFQPELPRSMNFMHVEDGGKDNMDKLYEIGEEYLRVNSPIIDDLCDRLVNEP